LKNFDPKRFDYILKVYFFQTSCGHQLVKKKDGKKTMDEQSMYQSDSSINTQVLTGSRTKYFAVDYTKASSPQSPCIPPGVSPQKNPCGGSRRPLPPVIKLHHLCHPNFSSLRLALHCTLILEVQRSRIACYLAGSVALYRPGGNTDIEHCEIRSLKRDLSGFCPLGNST